MLIASRVEFLSMILLIVYVGAIAILFLFVVMLFNLNPADEAEEGVEETNGVGSKFSFFFAILFTYYSVLQVHFGDKPKFIIRDVTDFAKTFDYFSNDALLFNQRLYGEDAFLFLLSGMLLLVSMVGAIVLAMSTLESLEVKSSTRQAFIFLVSLENGESFLRPSGNF